MLKHKDLHPHYVAVVFDVSAPTFRDKLFASYKAQRPPMPDDLAVQIPFVRRYCEAMRLPILEYPGYEADDVIASLARQAAQEDLDIFIVTSDKDLMQLVGGRVRLLNPAKNDLVVDAKMVEEIMGVPPEKVADVMALMGDSIDNIPGARDPNEKTPPGERRKAGIGEVGARQLIQQFGSAEEALARAREVKRSSYREALEKYGEFVRLSKQLAKIPTDAPVSLSLDALKIQEPDAAALRELYTELGFTSLLRELAPVVDRAKIGLRGSRFPGRAPAISRGDSARRRTRAFGFLSIPKIRTSRASARRFSPSKFRPSPERRVPFPPMRKIKRSPRSRNGSRIRAQPKIVHDPKLVHMLASPDSSDERPADRRHSRFDHALFVSLAAHHRQPRISRSRASSFESHSFRRRRRACRFSASSRADPARGS